MSIDRSLRVLASIAVHATLTLSASMFVPSVASAARPRDSSELSEPAICARDTTGTSSDCEVTDLSGPALANGDPPRKVKITLTAETKEVKIGGYLVTTENYGAYVPPVVKALPGDTVAAHLINKLSEPVAANSGAEGHAAHRAAGENPTNLHYFHGGIVTPNNGNSPVDASGGTNIGPADPAGPAGKGDNIYVTLRQGKEFSYEVPVPLDLNSLVLEGKGGPIPHPAGLNWYHSHLHGISSDQVLGGLSGLLSIGDDRANVYAKCEQGTPEANCTSASDDLRKRTIVRYALLRDIRLDLGEGAALPQDASQETVVNKAKWTPRKRDFLADEKCFVFANRSTEGDQSESLREGFCQPDIESAWLFTLNGQRFPKVTVEGGKNLLLRLGNLSANVAYWLELHNKDDGTVLPLTILSLDGVVPARPKPATGPGVPEATSVPVDAIEPPDLLFMPASRVEIFVRNDHQHEKEQTYILRSKRLDTGKDVWPAVQLAKIVLKPSPGTVAIAVALNAPQERLSITAFSAEAAIEPQPPAGCIRDVNPGEHRRVTFAADVPNPVGSNVLVPWGITTEIVAYPPSPGQPTPKLERLFALALGTKIGRAPFERYVRKDESINWAEKHVCIKLDRDGQNSPQLWVLNNSTRELHNFHIHQMKFRLARRSELEDRCIKLEDAQTTQEGQPKYDLLEEDIPAGAGACRCLCAQQGESLECTTCSQSTARSSAAATAASSRSDPVWHDTIPVPAGKKVYVMMSFVDPRQVGRFVFHCHILKHEDKGLMAPVEVWDPKTVLGRQ